MATMATKSAGGGALGTPPSTAAPSAISSRQVSRDPSASMNNNPYDDGAVGEAGGGVGRGGRANSLAEPPAAVADGGARGDGASTAARGGNTAAAATSSSAPPPPAAGTDNGQPPPTSPHRNAGSSPNSSSSPAETISYSAERIIGNGSFGVVFQASVVETGEIVAIKKVLQDKRFKNRELQIMRQLVKDGHSNIVGLKHCFYSQVSVLT